VLRFFILLKKNIGGGGWLRNIAAGSGAILCTSIIQFFAFLRRETGARVFK
jgi:hypothetical protein